MECRFFWIQISGSVGPDHYHRSWPIASIAATGTALAPRSENPDPSRLLPTLVSFAVVVTLLVCRCCACAAVGSKKHGQAHDGGRSHVPDSVEEAFGTVVR